MIGTSTVEKLLIGLEDTAKSSIDKVAGTVLSSSKEYRISAFAMIDKFGRATYRLELTIFRPCFQNMTSESPTGALEKLVSDLISMRYSVENPGEDEIVGRMLIDKSTADAEYRALRFALSFYIKRISNREDAAGGSSCTH